MTLDFKGLVHPKMKIFSPLVNQDVDEFVSSSEQIGEI